MAKPRIKDLDYETQLDVLSRMYLIECAKNPNVYISRSLKYHGGESHQIYLGKAKNMFLCGQINEYGYARGDGDYELNRLSIPGALFNYMFRDRLSKIVYKNGFRYDNREMQDAYDYVIARGYKPFYTYMKYAFLSQGPSSIEDSVVNYGKVVRPSKALVLDDEVATSTISMEKFSLQDITIIKNHLKATMRAYAQQYGIAEKASVDIFDRIIDDLPTASARVKKPAKVERPSKSLFTTYPDMYIMSEGQAPHNSVGKASDATFDLVEVINEEEESLILTFTHPKTQAAAYDKYGTLLAWDQNGALRNPDGTIFEGDTVYDEDPMLNPNAAYTKDGLRYNGEYEDAEDDEEEYIIPGSRGVARDEAGRLINTANGYSSADLRELARQGYTIVEDEEETEVISATTDTPPAPTKKSKTNPDQLTLFDFVDTQNQEQ